MTQLHRTRVGVDERHHRLQGDEEPEHQGAVDSVGQVSLGGLKNHVARIRRTVYDKPRRSDITTS
jgi:hypothetical protein